MIKFISIRSVLDNLQDTIKEPFWTEAVMLENCARAMQKIGAIVQLQTDIKYLKIENHKACLPKGLININQIAYKDRINVDRSLMDDSDHSANAELVERIESPEFIIKRDIMGIEYGSYMDNSNLWRETNLLLDLFKNNWLPMKASTSTFFLSNILCEHCPKTPDSLYRNGMEYTTTSDGTLVTSLKDGFVCISYLRYPIDENGDFLIPDSENFKDALRVYCMMRLWEARWNMKEEGAERIYLHYLSLWGTLKAKAYADIRDSNVTELENIKNIYTNLLPNTKSFMGFFGNLGHQERLNNF